MQSSNATPLLLPPLALAVPPHVDSETKQIGTDDDDSFDQNAATRNPPAHLNPYFIECGLSLLHGEHVR